MIHQSKLTRNRGFLGENDALKIRAHVEPAFWGPWSRTRLSPSTDQSKLLHRIWGSSVLALKPIVHSDYAARFIQVSSSVCVHNLCVCTHNCVCVCARITVCVCACTSCVCVCIYMHTCLHVCVDPILPEIISEWNLWCAGERAGQFDRSDPESVRHNPDVAPHCT